MKKFHSVMLVMLCTLLFLTACSAPTNPSENIGEVVEEEVFVPVMRFAVAGDVHIRSANPKYLCEERLASVFSTAYSYADSHDTYKGLDGIFLQVTTLMKAKRTSRPIFSTTWRKTPERVLLPEL